MQTFESPTQSDPQYEAGSYRDRNGRIFYTNQGVFRALSRRALADWEQLAATEFCRRAMADGKLVSTQRLDESIETPLLAALPWEGEWAAVLKHQLIPFVTYPYEWSFGMLKDAAILQLELLETAINDDLILKDGSAFNVQWIGARPIFIDIPSFERLAPGEPWAGYRQFCQTMLFPLILQAYKNVPFQPWLRGSIDGIDPEHCRNMMSLRDLFRSGVMTHVFLHAKLQSRYADTKNVKANLRSAGFNKELIRANVRGLRRLVAKLEWQASQSTWSDYATTNTYSDAERESKERFVREAVTARPRKLVWDLGSNTGNYSRIAAETAESVVAMDADHLAIERLYQALRAEENRTILPIVSNLVDASPALGWRGRERRTLADRGKPDLALALALIHHIVIGANIPLNEFVEWLASLGCDLVIEFVTKEDAMVQKLLRNKRDDYTDYDISFFERCLAGPFEIVRREPLASGTRTLYHAARRPSP